MRILHVIHDLPPLHVAGAELYAVGLAAELNGRPGVEVEFLCAEYDPAATHGSLRARSLRGIPVTELVNNWAFSSLEQSVGSPETNRQLARALGSESSGQGHDLLHLHSLQGLSLDLPRLALDLGMPSVATLHDYSLFCPAGGQLLPHGLTGQATAPCQVLDPERCSRCFSRSPLGKLLGLGRALPDHGGLQQAARAAALLRRVLPAGFGPAGQLLSLMGRGTTTPAQIARRLERARAAAQLIDPLVAPSKAMAERMISLGLPSQRVEVSDYGFVPLPRLARSRGQGRLRLGYVGSLVPHKGADLLLKAAPSLGASVEILVHGDPKVCPEYSAKLRRMARGLPVQFAGPFTPEQAPEVYAGLDCLVVTSRWPENSPLVIHEAFQAGLPVVAPEPGGCAELVRHGLNGLHYETGSAESLAQQLRCLIQRPELLRDLADGVPEVKSLERDADQWLERYQRSLTAHRTTRGKARKIQDAPPDLSILLLTRDGAATLPRLLAALDAQDTSRRVERVALDSGSTDGTHQLLLGAGFMVHPVAPEDFQHGRTRNLGLSRCSGRLVVLLVQDAVPLGEGWLEALLEPLEADPRLAGSFARQVPRADADPLTRFYARQHPAASRAPRRIFLPPGPAETLEQLSPGERLELCTFDNVCSCVRREVWQRTPFPQHPFAEDLAWARQVLLEGHGLAYAPAAVVEHSHHRPVLHELRRTYLAHRQLRRLFGLRTVPSPAHLGAAMAGTVGSHLLTLAGSPFQAGRYLPRALALGLALPLGQYLGALSADTGLALLDTGGV